MDESTKAPAPVISGVKLSRQLGLLALVATAVCNVIGAGINVLIVGIQQKVPGIGPYVPAAFLIGAFPALFAALCYAILASAMPRAGGGYVYVSRALNPFLGFMATFSKWFGLAAAIGVIAYMDVALLQSGVGYLSAHVDVGWLASFLSSNTSRLVIPLGMILVFWAVNIVGIKTYGWTVTVLMFLMLSGGLFVIVYGFATSPQQYAAAVAARPDSALGDALARAGLAGQSVLDVTAGEEAGTGGFFAVLKAAAFLFFAYIGFAGISQAGGETRSASRVLPRAFLVATSVICAYYLLFSAAVYHAVPWQFSAAFVAKAPAEASAPLLIGVLMPPVLASFVALAAALALANDIPPMLMATSRLFFSWARDGIFPKGLASLNQRYRTPHWALTACALVAALFAILCYRWESYVAGVDTIVITLTFTYLLIACSVLTLPRRNPRIWGQVRFIRSRGAQTVVASAAILFLTPLLVLELRVQNAASVLFWLAAMTVAAAAFAVMWRRARGRGEDMEAVFRELPTGAEEIEESPEVI